MGRGARENRPRIKPVQKIQLSGENTILRGAAAALFLLIGAGALVYAVSHLFAAEPGWQTIQAGTADGPGCGEEFVFLYELGAEGQSVRQESRALTQLYTQACRKAFQLFSADESFEDVVSLREINQRPNEVLEVDQALYGALEAVQEAGNRTLYLGPVYARYNDLFLCEDDAQLVDFDPRLSPEVAEEYAAIAVYAADPGQIDVELLGENKIRLSISEEYLAYAQREGIDRFLDFGWMRNAFVADYLADTMIEAGFTCGAISSYDGFTRCLDRREGSYGLPLLDWLNDRPIEAGTLEYQGPMSLVSLRSFPAAEGDEYRYYRLRNGEVRTLYLDPKDGLCRLSVSSMIGCSPTCSCAELAMEVGQTLIADSVDESSAAKLLREGTQFAWCLPGERQINTLGLDVTITNLYENETGICYTVQ